MGKPGGVRSVSHLVPVLCVCMGGTSHTAGSETVAVVAEGALGSAGHPVALIVIPANPQPTVEYAAGELVRHIEMASAARLSIVKEPSDSEPASHRLYLGNTRAAADVGIDVNALPSEAFVLRTVGGNLFIAAKDAPGSPLETDNTAKAAHRPRKPAAGSGMPFPAIHPLSFIL
jgi:hypothetical protein